ncbi:MAG: hypothetical protein MUD10_00810 [Candidatus Pacebacteria bacterium]|nr:hypothetical protein [Candidatus Paceibacterota bacterium]
MEMQKFEGESEPQPEQKQLFIDKEIDAIMARITRPPEGQVDYLKKRPEELEAARNEILLDVGENCPEGVNLSRAKDFVESMGLEVNPVVFVDESNTARINEILTKHSIIGMEWVPGESGDYSQQLGLVFVKINRETGGANELFRAESLAVHEMFHSTSKYGGTISKAMRGRIEMADRRLGFCSGAPGKPFGEFLEEGFAEFMRGRYSKIYADENYKKSVEIATGKKFSENVLKTSAGVGEYLLPVKYAMPTATGEAQWPVASVAAFAIEQFCEVIPDLESHMVEARKSASGLKKVFKDIESVCPGLYLELQKGAYDENSFVKKLLLVRERVAEYTAKKNSEASQGSISSGIAET